MGRVSMLWVGSIGVAFFSACSTTHWVHLSELTSLETRDDRRNGPSTKLDVEAAENTGSPDPAAEQAKRAPAAPRDDGSRSRAGDRPLGNQKRPRQLRDAAGEEIDLEPGTKLYVHLLNGTRVGGDASATEVRNGQFVWMANTKSEVAVPIDQIESAEVDVPDLGKTLGVIGLGLLGLVGLTVVVGLVLLVTLSGVSGRPLRVRGQPVVAGTCESTAWLALGPMPSSDALSSPARAMLAAEWLRDARSEHASVPAFSRISMTLVALGAPSRLVEAAHRAAIEEIEHARRTFALATAYAERTLGPGPLPALLSERCTVGELNPAEAVRKLAVESLADGCLSEGFAAAVARESHARASDSAVRETLAIIARDEASHARLSWDILDWCLAIGGEDTCAAVRVKLRQLPRRIEAKQLPQQIETELERHGRLRASIRFALFNEIRTETMTRVSLMLEQQTALVGTARSATTIPLA